jgi:DNA invertase Pin-like site-specific DNA recombinase
MLKQQALSALRVGYLCLRPGAPTGAADPHTRLIEAGIGRLFIDIFVENGNRAQLECAIAAVGDGDLLVTLNLDMLAGSVHELLGLHARLEARGAGLLVLEIAGGLVLNTLSPEGKAILGALAVVEELRRSADTIGRMFLPVASVAAAPVDPRIQIRPRGRPPLAADTSTEVARLYAQGVRALDIAARLGIGRASVYRILQQETPSPAVAPPSRALAMAGRLRNT